MMNNLLERIEKIEYSKMHTVNTNHNYTKPGHPSQRGFVSSNKESKCWNNYKEVIMAPPFVKIWR